MRFEIGPGGGFLVLIGLLGLSAAVFFLGMISGREMALGVRGGRSLDIVGHAGGRLSQHDACEARE